MYDLQAVLASTTSYLQNYISLVPAGNVLDLLADQVETVTTFYRAIPEDKLTFAYAPGKWTPKDILLHLVDSERVFSYRAMRFARNDSSELVGFDENAYVPAAQANSRSLDSLLDEFRAQRAASLAMFRSFDEPQFWRSGRASGAEASVIGLIYAICGHALHHLHVLEERYID